MAVLVRGEGRYVEENLFPVRDSEQKFPPHPLRSNMILLYSVPSNKYRRATFSEELRTVPEDDVVTVTSSTRAFHLD